ncbi:MAG: tetratricopeptide repeat protein, partial [Pseudomonadota bacterium]
RKHINADLGHAWIRRAAKQGVLDAQTTLGAMYENGIGVEVNRDEAERWYQIAAKRGDAAAMVGLGRLYRLQASADGSKQREAVGWFERAADLGDPQAQYYLGKMYLVGAGVPQDRDLALAHFVTAAEHDYADAYVALTEMYAQGGNLHSKALEQQVNLLGEGRALMMKGMRYELGDGMPKDMARAAETYALAAQKNMPFAAYRLAELYLDGQGVHRDTVQAYYYLNIAAKAGMAPAHLKIAQLLFQQRRVNTAELLEHLEAAAALSQPLAAYWLSILYRNPIPGMVKNIDASIEWHAKADDMSGNALGKYEIGRMYDRGLGFSRDFAEAFRWYLPAAEQGLQEAQIALGNLYYSGQGIEQNFGEAMYWYKKASVDGAPAASYQLALMYANGEGADMSLETAAHWMRLSAMAKYRPAQFRLAQWYRDGVGVKQSDVEAYAWWRTANAQIFEGSYREFETVYRRLTPKELKKAQILALRYQGDYAPD